MLRDFVVELCKEWTRFRTELGDGKPPAGHFVVPGSLAPFPPRAWYGSRGQVILGPYRDRRGGVRDPGTHEGPYHYLGEGERPWGLPFSAGGGKRPATLDHTFIYIYIYSL